MFWRNRWAAPFASCVKNVRSRFLIVKQTCTQLKVDLLRHPSWVFLYIKSTWTIAQIIFANIKDLLDRIWHIFCFLPPNLPLKWWFCKAKMLKQVAVQCTTQPLLLWTVPGHCMKDAWVLLYWDRASLVSWALSLWAHAAVLLSFWDLNNNNKHIHHIHPSLSDCYRGGRQELIKCLPHKRRLISESFPLKAVNILGCGGLNFNAPPIDQSTVWRQETLGRLNTTNHFWHFSLWL